VLLVGGVDEFEIKLRKERQRDIASVKAEGKQSTKGPGRGHRTGRTAPRDRDRGASWNRPNPRLPGIRSEDMRMSSTIASAQVPPDNGVRPSNTGYSLRQTLELGLTIKAIQLTDVRTYVTPGPVNALALLWRWARALAALGYRCGDFVSRGAAYQPPGPPFRGLGAAVRMYNRGVGRGLMSQRDRRGPWTKLGACSDGCYQGAELRNELANILPDLEFARDFNTEIVRRRDHTVGLVVLAEAGGAAGR
jgi:hypothetical protein